MAKRLKWPTCTAAQFAELCKVSAQTVTSWIDAGMPCQRGRGRGHVIRVDPSVAVGWALARREPQGSERQRLAKEQANKIALENAVKRGDLVHRGQVTEALTLLAADLSARHDALPGRMASELAGLNDPALIRERLLDELRTVRGAFAGAVVQFADALEGAPGDGGDPQAAAAAEREPVGGGEPGVAAGDFGARAVPG